MLLALTEVGEGRSENFVHDAQQIDELVERLGEVTSLVESLGGAGHHLSVLHDLQALQDVGQLATSDALDHEIVACGRHLNDCSTVVGCLAAEANHVARQLIEAWPVLQAGVAVALEPIEILESRLAILALVLRVDWSIVLIDGQARLDGSHTVDVDRIAAEVSDHAWIAGVIEERQCWINGTTNEDGLLTRPLPRSSVLVQLGHLVRVELYELQTAQQQRCHLPQLLRLRCLLSEVTCCLQTACEETRHKHVLKVVCGGTFLLMPFEVGHATEIILRQAVG